MFIFHVLISRQKSIVEFKGGDNSNQEDVLYSYEGAVCGSISGGFAAAVTTPLDVIKTRLMLGSVSDVLNVLGVCCGSVVSCRFVLKCVQNIIRCHCCHCCDVNISIYLCYNSIHRTQMALNTTACWTLFSAYELREIYTLTPPLNAD